MKRLVNVAIALAAFLATCAAFNRLLPQPAIENVTPKLRFFAEHKDEFDTLFIGTSRIHYQVSPSIFDAITAQAGHPTHSFNFGVDGMHPPESFFVTEKILASRPRKLRWVFFELEGVQIDWWRAGAQTRRLEYWHDWKQTSLVIRRATDPRGNSPWYVQTFRAVMRHRAIALHLQLFTKQFSRVGDVADLMANWNNDARPGFVGQLGRAKDGYDSPLAPMAPDRVPAYEKKLRHEAGGAHLQFVDPHAERVYRDFASRFAALGARTFFVITPVATQSPQRFHPPEPGPILLFNNAKRFPQLYDPAVRADEGHLSQAGADEFTRLLAQQFIQATR